MLSLLRRQRRCQRWQLGGKGVAQDPWAAFCASGEIPSAAAAKDVAGSMSRRLREASQELKQVADFADRVASGVLTADVAAKVERLRA